MSTSFLNTDNKMVTVVMNETEVNLKYKLIIGEFETETEIPAHSIQTLVY